MRNAADRARQSPKVEYGVLKSLMSSSRRELRTDHAYIHLQVSTHTHQLSLQFPPFWTIPTPNPDIPSPPHPPRICSNSASRKPPHPLIPSPLAHEQTRFIVYRNRQASAARNRQIPNFTATQLAADRRDRSLVPLPPKRELKGNPVK